jgi:hypothetical protein
MGSRRSYALACVAGVLVAAIGCESRPPVSSDDVQPGVSTAAKTSPTPTPPAELLPNLRSQPAEKLRIQTTDEGRRQLRFAGILANVGDGPLIVRPDTRSGCRVGQLPASQEIPVDVDGDHAYTDEVDRRRVTREAGCMLKHPTHKHWHFDAMARYVLTRPGEERPIVAREKVSFCLRDSRRLPGARWASIPRRYGKCEGADSIQAISVGWADVYKSSLPGQALPLPTDLPDGEYCLHTVADPLDLLRERREDDNAAVRALLIEGDRVRTQAPSGCSPWRTG